MKKNGLLTLIIAFLTIGIFSQASAQVSGISYTLSPTGEYSWHNEKSGMADGFTIGGQLGFGFGQNVELSAIYLQGLNMKTDGERFGIELPNYAVSDLDYKRYGGEIKLNLSRTALKPYISIGTGIQEVGLDGSDTYSQIYTTGGIGVKLTAADRYTLAVQGNTNYFNFNPARTFLTDEYIAENNIDISTIDDELINNYSLRASLLFYIGGRDPQSITDIDAAYWDNFSSGFRGLSVPIEPTVMKVNFHDDLRYRDAYFAGGSLGFDFGPLVGVRGFYYQALEDGEYTSFDKLAMYGGEAKFKLNEGKGFVPSIIIGGGNIDARNSYVGKDSLTTNLGDEAFASGGLGLDLPFSKYFKASGFVKAILTSGAEEVDEIRQPDDIMTSWAYGVSLNFVLGREAAKPDVIKKSAFDEYMTAQEEDYEKTIANLRGEYNSKIDSLNTEISKAMAENDARKVEQLSQEVESAEKVKDRLDRDAVNAMKDRMNADGKEIEVEIEKVIQGDVEAAESVIKMTPSEFQLIIRDLLDARENEMKLKNEMRKEMLLNQDQSAVETLKKDMEADKAMDEVLTGMESMQKTISDMNNKMAEMKAENEQLKKEAEERLVTAQREKEIQMLMDEITKNREKMAEMKATQNSKLDNIQDEQTRNAVATYTKAMEKQLEDANKKIMDLSNQISDMEKNHEAKNEIRYDRYGNPISGIGVDDNNNYVERVSNASKVKTRAYDEEKKGFFNKLRYQGMSGFAGFSVGGSATFNLGYRLHYALVDNAKVEFMPETFFGLGSPSSFGLSANALYKLDIIKKVPNVKPYVGAGLGLLKVGDADNEDKIKGGINLILGTSLNVMNGDLYVDLTSRNFFDYNQIVVGYKLPF